MSIRKVVNWLSFIVIFVVVGCDEYNVVNDDPDDGFTTMILFVKLINVETSKGESGIEVWISTKDEEGEEVYYKGKTDSQGEIDFPNVNLQYSCVVWYLDKNGEYTDNSYIGEYNPNDVIGKEIVVYRKF